MSFLAPLFLLGAVAVALPFWLHRLQTESSDRKPFSSAMLLETSEQRIHVKKKLKYLALLALRVALLALLALAFAKPLWTDRDALPGPGPEGTHLILVDTSASMQRDGMFEAALGRARDAIESAPGGAVLQVLAASHSLREVSEVSADRGAHVAALRSLQADASRLDFGQAMAGIDRLAEFLPAPVTLHFVSDMQDSALPTRFADLVTTRIAALETHLPITNRPQNWSVDAIRPTASGIDVVVNSSANDATTANVQLTLNGIAIGTREVTGPGTTSLSFDGAVFETGDNLMQATIEADDDLDIDNRRFHVMRSEPPAPIPLLTADPSGLPVTYLSAALHADRASNWRVEPVVANRFDPRTLSRYRWIIVDDVAAIGPELEDALREFVRQGGGLLAFAGQRSANAMRIPILGNAIAGASIGRGDGDFLSIGQVDSAHPLLVDTDGWYSVRVTQTIPIDTGLDDEVLIRLENDEPFVIERRIGQGRALLVAGGLENQWNDLPVRPVFVAFAVEAARYLSGVEQIDRSFAAGEALTLSIAGGASGQVIDPDGESTLSLADTTRAQRIPLHKTGFYEVYTSQGNYSVAVNPDRRESDMTPVDQETLLRWEDAMSGPAEAVQSSSAPQEADPVELWHALLFMLVLVLIAESILANVHLAPRTGGELSR